MVAASGAPTGEGFYFGVPAPLDEVLAQLN